MTTTLAPESLTHAVSKVVGEIEFLERTIGKPMLGTDVCMHVQDLCVELRCTVADLPGSLQFMAELAGDSKDRIFDRAGIINAFHTAALQGS